ncbi:hypothetical protein [Arenimonas oryziterrae]|uniref:Uncharacterized protein n=1 Tax=Arenimonas oryziterrae DSM 21050 = YC6267 TaxID=1121015 RepID=A0A091AVV3_9GAMM|nr:hypothetical protein [Arenimonas oryziterrae]KFN43561.1 hypothetical protein N789_09815 [Arenimonas oryziterrae DSM 21050 = YC6267]
MSFMPIFMHRLFSFRPGKPRHPLLRLALGLLGIALLALLVVFGLFIGLGMLLFAAVRRFTRPQPVIVPAAAEGALDGEYSVVHKHEATLSLR